MIPNQMAKRMQEGQLPSEQTLQVIRTVSLQHDSATYQFARGFMIVATAKGVSFGGASTAFNPGQMVQLKKYIRYAEKVSHSLLMNEGIPPQSELYGDLKLRERLRDNLHTVWYQGHRPDYEVSHTDRTAAIRSLRAKWILIHGTKTP